MPRPMNSLTVAKCDILTYFGIWSRLFPRGKRRQEWISSLAKMPDMNEILCFPPTADLSMKSEGLQACVICFRVPVSQTRLDGIQIGTAFALVIQSHLAGFIKWARLLGPQTKGSQQAGRSWQVRHVMIRSSWEAWHPGQIPWAPSKLAYCLKWNRTWTPAQFNRWPKRWDRKTCSSTLLGVRCLAQHPLGCIYIYWDIFLYSHSPF